jgi:hypothetical protein
MSHIIFELHNFCLDDLQNIKDCLCLAYVSTGFIDSELHNCALKFVSYTEGTRDYVGSEEKDSIL